MRSGCHVSVDECPTSEAIGCLRRWRGRRRAQSRLDRVTTAPMRQPRSRRRLPSVLPTRPAPTMEIIRAMQRASITCSHFLRWRKLRVAHFLDWLCWARSRLAGLPGRLKSRSACHRFPRLKALRRWRIPSARTFPSSLRRAMKPKNCRARWKRFSRSIIRVTK